MEIMETQVEVFPHWRPTDDTCDACGAPSEVRVTAKLEEGVYQADAERCTACDWQIGLPQSEAA